ncbi:hypothetical protein [Burkholderia diffusa]|uniref:hypothetical protein n=1 Tax=Burkholderia diffusa TaxID=488732 RepID=UPI00075CC637|nr:hypothetical protein [Burkholderia diffusa]KVC40157.1 hypothetical protein WI71_29245 [Burkholderia diffusa]
MIQELGQQALTVAADVTNLGRNRPRSVGTVHYGPDGASVATTGQASYTDVSDAGGTIRYAASLAGGAPHSMSDIVIDAQGRAVSSATRLLAADGMLRRTVQGIYRALALDPAGWPTDGVAHFSLAGPDGAPSHVAEMTYANERPAHYSLVKHASGGKGAIAGRLKIDFSNAVLVGTRLAGGELAIVRHVGPALTLASTARSILSAHGTPDRLLAINYAEDGATVRQRVESDYGGVVFDARGRILDGHLLVALQRAGSNTQMVTLFRFANGKLTSTRVLKPGDPVPPPRAAAPAKPVPGPWQPTRAPDRTRRAFRADGSLAQVRDEWMSSGGAAPWRSLVTGFATDGRTAVRVTDVDYRAALFATDGQPIGGTIISTRFEGGVRSSTTHVVY